MTLECCLKWIMSLLKTFEMLNNEVFVHFLCPRRSLIKPARDQKKTNLTSDFDNDSLEAFDADVSLHTLSSSSETSEAKTSQSYDFRL
ncbi:hypothetical protein A2U01_0003679 [Trifolium medium]|uniref:Uncharacterized protein n=1 Tax=Trifolium medium TaxID=97028 RepID=A0A392M612_9FABA|nr:hypothetical protein [Trifolium medium]